MNLKQELEREISIMRAASGGVNPEECIRAARRVMEIRTQLRDNSAMVQHLRRVMERPE